MIYLDANIFLNAVLNSGEKGKRARALLDDVQKGKKRGATSTLTYDELFWVVQKHRSFDDALEAARALLGMRNLTFLDVDSTVLWRAYDLAKAYRLNPRDSIHLACALANRIFTMISEDKDFDEVKEIERKGLSHLVEYAP